MKTSSEELAALEENFFAAMDDDLNTPGALAAIFQFINAQQTIVFHLSPDDARAAHELLIQLLNILGIVIGRIKIPASITTLIRKRETVRAQKDFAQSDELRKQIESKGYMIEDTPAGPLCLPSSSPHKI